MHRQWRERKGSYGEMQQLDGSEHDWFEGRAPYCTLIKFVDDATSKITWAEFAPVNHFARLQMQPKIIWKKMANQCHFILIEVKFLKLIFTMN